MLLVDDEPGIRTAVQAYFEDEGFAVSTASDGEEGWQKAQAEMPDVVLSDVMMPRMDGFDLVRNVRADARLAGLPVIMITSRIAQKHRDYAQQLGVNHYLGKPYSEEELLALVARYAAVNASTT